MQTRWEDCWAFPSAELPSLEQPFLPTQGESKLCPAIHSEQFSTGLEPRQELQCTLCCWIRHLHLPPAKINQPLIQFTLAQSPGRGRFWFTIQIAPHKGIRVSCLKDFWVWELQECACSQGFLVGPRNAMLWALHSLSVPPATQCNRKHNHPNQSPANLYWQSRKPR